MKYFFIGLSLVLMALFGQGCIKDEAKNMEADIIAVRIPDSLINGKPILNNKNVAIFIKQGVLDVTQYALHLDLTKGATIQPTSGSLQDFSKPVLYTVTSEDGNYKKTYTVTMVAASVPSSFDFETVEYDSDKNYVIFYEALLENKQYLWGSGNSPFAALVGSSPTADMFPTQSTTVLVQQGNAALHLETKSTGAVGEMMKMPIAAGNLFIGSLDASNLFNPITKMGLPFNKIPVKLEGYYKYTPGATVKDKDGNTLPLTDECAIYAVLYNRVALMQRTDLSYLSNDNIKTDESIIAIAEIPSGVATSGNGFIQFSIPFEYKTPIDRFAAEGFEYNLALVFSSSKNGALYQGAAGSVLIVDNIRIITE